MPHVVTLLQLVRWGLKPVSLAAMCVCAELAPHFRDELDEVANRGDTNFMGDGNALVHELLAPAVGALDSKHDELRVAATRLLLALTTKSVRARELRAASYYSCRSQAFNVRTAGVHSRIARTVYWSYLAAI